MAAEEHTKPGFAAMIEAAGGPTAEVQPADEGQPDMFGDRGQPGRPKGSRNRRTQELLDDLVASGKKTPLEYLMSVFNDDNAKKDERIRAAVACMPYAHQKLPVLVDTQGAPALLVMGDLSREEMDQLTDDEGTVTIPTTFQRVDENGGNQPFSGDDESEVGREELDADD